MLNLKTLLLLTALAFANSNAFAQSPTERDLRAAISSMAERIADALQTQGQSVVVVGEFKDEFDMTVTGGAQIRRLLIESLKRHQINAALTGEVSVRGAIEKVIGEDHSLTGEAPRRIPVALISYKLAKRNGQLLLDSTKMIDSERAKTAITKPDDVFALIGGNGSVPTGGSEFTSIFARDEAFDRALDKSNVHDRIAIQESYVRPVGQPFAVSILVAPKGSTRVAPHKSAYQPAGIEFRDGLPFVKIEPGQVYAIRLLNEADFDMAASVTIDGLDLFAFSDAESSSKSGNDNYMVLPPNTYGDIYGWYRNNQTSDTFLVQHFVDGRLGDLLKDRSSVGAISVTFHAAWQDQPPADEQNFANTKNVGSVETARGAPIDTPYETIERTIGVLRSGVTVWYDKE